MGFQQVLAACELTRYFDDVDMKRLRWHQAKLLSVVTGGPDEYPGGDLGEAPSCLDISGTDFDRVVGHLATALAEVGVDAVTAGALGAALTRSRAAIVTSTASVG